MLKKIIALLLCVLMMIPLFSSCAKRDENDMGPMITMYLSDEIYNFDPAYAYYNATTLSIVSMMFETLFKLDGNGKIQNALVDTYEYIENPAKDEYKLVLSLKDTCWSNKDPVTADNVMYAWKRLLNANNSFEAASLLFDIKNARAVKEGDVTIDDLGVEANSSKILTVYFEGPIDLDAFLLNLTSVVTAPLPESHIEKDADWAKKGSTMICSGPFKLGKTRYVNVDSSNLEIAKDSTDKIYCEDDYALDEWNKPIKTTTTEVKKLSYFVLERNNYYRLLLNVGVLGTESGVVTLEPSYTVLNWNDENINTSIEENVYLVVQEHDVFINNKNTYSVEFASSHDIEVQILSITQPYYVSNIAGTTTFCNYEEGRGLALVKSGTTGKVTIGTNTNAATQSLYRDCSVGVSGNTIVLNHEVVNMGKETVDKEYDIAPYTIVVYVKMVYGSGANEYYEDTIEFTQYPAIYVEAKQNSDYGDNNNNGDHNVQVNSYYGGYYASYTSTIPSNYTDRNYETFGDVPGLTTASDNVNPNMYVIHVTSMSDNEYTIGDPREMEINEDFIGSATWAMAPAIYPESPRRLTHYYRTNKNRTTNANGSSKNSSDYITGDVIAPVIRVASSYSVTSNTDSRDKAEKRCASYQEDGFPAGRWRMPTYAEAKFIYTLSWEGKIPLLFTNGRSYWCAHGYFMPVEGKVSLNDQANNTLSIRCVYDEWYWGSDQINNKSTFTWGDYPRDVWPPSSN